MSDRSDSRWATRRTAARLAAGFAVLALGPASAAHAAPATTNVFSATTTTVGVGGLPLGVAIGDLRSTTGLQAGANALACRIPPQLRPAGWCVNDIATGNVSDASVLLKDAGDAGFTAPGGLGTANIFTGSGANSIGIADFNSDGHNDLAIANSLDGDVEVVNGEAPNANDAQTGFSSADAQYIPISFTDQRYVMSVAIGDLGNGHADVVATVDGNGAGEIVLLINDGHEHFTQTALPTGVGPTQAVIGDFNRDGRPDIAVANYGLGNLSGASDPGLEVFLNNARGGYTTKTYPTGTVATSAGDSPMSLAAGDFNGDGATDLVTTNHDLGGDTVTVFVNDGRGNYTPSTIVDGDGVFEPFDRTPSIATGDLNGDGLDDFAITNMDADTITVFMAARNARGTLSFTPTTLPAGSGPSAIAIGHLDSRDGAKDIAVGDFFTSTVTLFTNTTPQSGLGLGLGFGFGLPLPGAGG
jgi:hypothetical protein